MVDNTTDNRGKQTPGECKMSIFSFDVACSWIFDTSENRQSNSCLESHRKRKIQFQL